MKLKCEWSEGCEPRFNEGDAGLDLRANIKKPVSIQKQIAKIPTGLKVEFPEGYCGLVLPRSSTGKKGIYLANTAPLVDNGFTGEIVLYVGSRNPYNIQPYERFAQLVLVPYYQVTELEFGTPRETERGNGSFGSTGRN